jgi:hypothetical protein
MLVTILLFIAYIMFFAWLLNKLPFVQKTNLPIYWVLIFFGVKILAGCFYGYIHTQSIYYPHKIDTWRFYFESLPETDVLLKNPAIFWDHLFANHYLQESGVLHHYNNYWNDLKHNIMVAFMSVLNILSGKNYYVNVIFYNFITVLGAVAFYRFCMVYFGSKAKWIIIVALCMPSFIFWGSGFHKEGLLFTGLASILYTSYKILYGRKSFGIAFVFAISVVSILMLRNYLLLFLLPFLFIWVLWQYYPQRKILVWYTATAFFFVLFFFNIGAIFPSLDLPNYTSNAQKEFIYLGGNTAIGTDTFAATAKGFLKYLPQSMHTAFLQPTPKYISITYLPSAIENLLFFALLLFALFYFNKKKTARLTQYLFLFFTIGCFIFLGYTVPVVGAVVRYKSILLPFLLVAVAQFVDWGRVASRLKVGS